MTKSGVVRYNANMGNETEKNIALNIKELRLRRGMKQSELGEAISYSDKTISKWENGTSVPDVTALVAIAEEFGVSVSDMVKPDAVRVAEEKNDEEIKENYKNDIAMLCLSVLSVFTVAVALYVALMIVKDYRFWQLFVWSVPVSAWIIYRYNHSHRDIKWLNAVLLSLLVWGIIASAYLQFLQYNLWALFFIGIPLEAMVIISTLFRKKTVKRRYRERSDK